MASTVEMKMALTGPRAGNTENINGHIFIDGVCSVIGNEDNLVPVIRVLASYGAYPDGSQSHKDAEDTYKKLIGESDGISDTNKKKKWGARNKVSGGVQSSGGEPSKEEAPGATENVESKSGTEAGSSDGSGHEYTGDAKRQETEAEVPTPVVNNRLLKAIYSLDPENDDHWVKTGKHVGKPKVSVIEEAYGEAGVNRSDVEDVAPEFDREASLKKLISEL